MDTSLWPCRQMPINVALGLRWCRKETCGDCIKGLTTTKQGYSNCVFGRRVIIETDHKPLQSIWSVSQASPRLQRMLITLQPHDIGVIWLWYTCSRHTESITDSWKGNTCDGYHYFLDDTCVTFSLGPSSSSWTHIWTENPIQSSHHLTPAPIWVMTSNMININNALQHMATKMVFSTHWMLLSVLEWRIRWQSGIFELSNKLLTMDPTW